jgi:peptide/nickel transport system permease protein
VTGLAALAKYIVKRAIQGVITLLVVTIIIWALFELMPGTPIDRFRADPTFDEFRLRQLEQSFGIGDDLHVKLGKFLWNMFTLNFGESFLERRPVVEIISYALPRTLFLFGAATILEYLFGILLGSFIAWKRGRFSEGGVVITSLFFYNMPSFWIGLILLWVFAFDGLRTGIEPVFPLRGWSNAEFTASKWSWLSGTDPANLWFQFVDMSVHAALPMAALVLITAAGAILLMQTAMLEVLGEDYILTARAKGLTARIVRRRHAARNAYLPVTTSFTISLAFAVGGAVILESIFSYFGMGYYFLAAIFNQDQFLAGATLFLISLLVIVGSIVADILYGVLDPRVRL